MSIEWEMGLRLLLSGILGGLIGYERQAHHKSAGLRTNMLVCIGSCLIMILSIKIYDSVQGLTNADPARLAAQVVSGIGFLGAGSIMKEGPTIRGLTTAASLWVVSGVGLAVGSGYYMGALMTAGLVLLTLSILYRMEKRDSASLVQVAVVTQETPGQMAAIAGLFGAQQISIRDVRLARDEKTVTLHFTLQAPRPLDCNLLAVAILELPGVISVQQQGCGTDS